MSRRAVFSTAAPTAAVTAIPANVAPAMSANDCMVRPALARVVNTRHGVPILVTRVVTNSVSYGRPSRAQANPMPVQTKTGARMEISATISDE